MKYINIIITIHGEEIKVMNPNFQYPFDGDSYIDDEEGNNWEHELMDTPELGNLPIKEIQLLSIKEDEVLILRVDENISQHELQRLVTMLQKTFPNQSNRMMILPKGVEIEKVKMEGSKAHPLY